MKCVARDQCAIVQYLVRTELGTHWIPKSVIFDPDAIDEGDDGVTVWAKKWFARASLDYDPYGD